jgi:hypothetical protein
MILFFGFYLYIHVRYLIHINYLIDCYHTINTLQYIDNYLFNYSDLHVTFIITYC